LNAATFAKACSLYVLSKAQTGDYEAATLAFSSFAPRIQSTDSTQQNLLLETQSQLTLLTNGKTALPAGINPLIPSALTDAQQRKVLRECNTLFTSGRFDQVDTKLRELLAARPSEAVAAEALLLQSKAVFKLGRDPEAIALLESILDQYPTSAQAAETLWHLGFYYYETCGDSANAVKYFQQIIEQFPNSKNIDGALYYVALDDLENGNGRIANTNLLRIDRNHQNGRYWSHALWTLAYQAYNKRNYTQAEVYVQKILNHPPDIAVLDRTLYLKGQLALKKNEFDTAFVAFREIGKLCPESPLYEESVQKAQLAAAKVGTLTR
jgi:outer membrane protein assembly factor BamD (BamD/ComL family)